jgi:anti-sigma factor RsiW
MTEYLDEALTPAERRRFAAHLARCQDCSVHLAEIRGTIAELGSLPPEPVEAAVREHLLALFRAWRPLRRTDG